MKNFKYQLALIASSVLLASCGGGGNSAGNPNTGAFDPAEAEPTVQFDGQAADGYLIGATVCVDLNENLDCDAGEPSAQTEAPDGSWNINSATQTQLDNFPLVLIADSSTTTDQDTGEAVAGEFFYTAPPGSTFLSPLTTLVQGLVSDGSSLSDAISDVEGALEDFGITAWDADYIAEENDELHQYAQVATQVLINTYRSLGNSQATKSAAFKVFGRNAQNMADILIAGAYPIGTSAAEIVAAENIDISAEVAEEADDEVIIISGSILEDMTWNADATYVLDGVVTVGAGNVTVNNDADVTAIKNAGVTLEIEAGADIRATNDGVLLITRGSKIMAEGTASNPITFSSLDNNIDGLGEWGGIVIQGFAPQYGAGGTGPCFGAGTVCNVQGEGGTEVAVYGGNDPADDSGVMRYVRIAEGGKVAGPNNEVNGLTLQGVGHATDLEYIQVHGNLDDGIEWFGGTVNLKYAVLTNNDDDSLDYDEGYKGNIQYAIIRMDQDASAPQGSNDPRGIEANSSDDDYVPETEATLANILVIGGPLNNNETSGQQPGMRLRGALTTSIYNTAVKDFDTGCIRIDDADTDLDGNIDVNSNVTLVNVFGDCEDGFYDKRAADVETNSGEFTVTLDGAYSVIELAAELGDAVNIPATDNGSGFTFDSTDFVGAVEPGTAAANAWWAGWTLDGTLVEDTTPVDPDDLPEVVISGTITSDMTFSANNKYILDGVVTVGEGNVTVNDQSDVDAIKAAGVTLEIQAGTFIEAESDGVLLITRGSKIMAEGTAAAPITFSSRDDGYDGMGEWGGVVIQGFAPQYGAGGTGACWGAGSSGVCNVEGEGGTDIAVYGGDDPADDSGVMRYVRIAEGGKVAGPNNEVNGLTLQGVGHGTDLEYIQVHGNLDDGIEWFGGTVDLKYAVLTNNDDDSLDYDEGYMGNIQHVIILMNQEVGATPVGSNDPRGIEANSSDDDYVPETAAAIANVTIIAGDNNNVSGSEQPGMRLRGALTTSIYNTAVEGFVTGCIRIDDADTDLSGSVDEFSDVSLINVIGDCIGGGFYDKRDADTESGLVGENVVTVDDAFAVNEIQARLASAPTFTKVDNGGSFTFDETDYIGAVAPGTAPEDAWWADWIIEGSLDRPMNTPDDTPSFVTCDTGFTQCDIEGTIDEDYRMTAGVAWTIDGTVNVGSPSNVNNDTEVEAVRAAGVTLTIEPGVHVQATSDAVLVVHRGSKLIAQGEADEPITFSSDDAGFSGLGEWGGVLLTGFAPQYGAGGTGACYGSGTTCNVEGEGGVGAVFGGNILDDNSGIIRYVRITEGGLNAGVNNEVNGLTMQGVGYGTDVQYVQVHSNLDDGIEWFGGTVNLKYAVLTSNDDDSLDYDEGYMGNIQYVIIQNDQTPGASPQGSNDPRGIEANSSDDEYVPETNAALANILIIGGDINDGEPGMRLRGALTTSVYNTAVSGYASECVRIDDADTDGVGGVDEFSDVTLVNVIGADCAAFYDHEVADSESGTVGLGTVTLDGAYALTDGAASLGAPVSIMEVDTGSGFVFDDTDFIGAVEPGTAEGETWFSKWIIEGTLD